MLNVSRDRLDVVARQGTARRGQVDRLPRMRRHGPHRPQGPQATEAGRGTRQLTGPCYSRLPAVPVVGFGFWFGFGFWLWLWIWLRFHGGLNASHHGLACLGGVECWG
jgi:hypothetical protein